MTATLVPSMPVTPEVPAVQLANSTVVLQLTVSVPSFRKKIASKNVTRADDQVDTTMLHVHKDLIDRTADEYTNITTAVSRLKTRWLANRQVNCKMLKGGMFCIPVTLVGEVDLGLQRFISDEWTPLIEVLATKFEDLKDAARKSLTEEHWDPTDYPDAAQLKSKFKIQVRWISFNVPAALEQLDKELFKRECSRAEAEWKEVSNDIRSALRESFSGMVEHLVERLTPEADGKPKRLHATAVDQLQDFLTTFGARNLTGDGALADLVDKAKRVISGVKTETLKKQETTRTRILNGFTQISGQLNELVITKRRAFDDTL